VKFDRHTVQASTRLAASIVTALVIGIHACFAQSAPDEGDLDSLLAAKDWNKLRASLSRPDRDVRESLDWMKAKLLSDGWYLVSVLLARDLWSIGAQAKVDDPEKDLRLTAGFVTLYTAAVILVDGSKCEDQTAPALRMDQLLQARAAALAFMKQQLPANKQKAIELAVALEATTAAARGSDDLVCRDGMAQMRAGLERGTQHTVPSAPGVFGKSVAVEARLAADHLARARLCSKAGSRTSEVKGHVGPVRHVSAALIDGREAG
jgi:hypothetical protein